MKTTPAECVIQAFGSIRKTAKAVGRTPGAVSFWRRHGWVPSEIAPVVLRYARAHGLRLTAEELILGRE